MGEAWGDKRDWPDVPERHLESVRADAAWQLTSSAEHAIGKIATIDPELVRVGLDVVGGLVKGWGGAMVQEATGGGDKGRDARRFLVEWFRPAEWQWPKEPWWWTPCGLVAAAWEEDGHWQMVAKGQVPGWVSAATVARHAKVSDRTVRRWGDNRKRVRQRGSVDDDKRRLYHRGDVSKLIVMRYCNLGQ